MKPPTKLMMAKSLEAMITHITLYRIIVIVQLQTWEKVTREKHFLDHNRLVRQNLENLFNLPTGPGEEENKRTRNILCSNQSTHLTQFITLDQSPNAKN